MEDRCCTLCAHNPYTGPKEGWWTRLKWWARWQGNRLARRLLNRPVFYEPAPATAGCLVNPRMFCYDVHGSEGCRRSLSTARPEFLACRACSNFAMKEEV